MLASESQTLLRHAGALLRLNGRNETTRSPTAFEGEERHKAPFISFRKKYRVKNVRDKRGFREWGKISH